MKKKDVYLIFGVCVAAALLWLGIHFLAPRDRTTVKITVDGVLYGEYDLNEDQEISIGNTNVCRISDGKVKMIQADCPDQLCVHQRAVDAAGGSIICLPNKVVIETTGASGTPGESGNGGIDAVV